VEKLYKIGYDVQIHLYGEGSERSILEKYISDHQLNELVHLKGNQSKEILKLAYQESHFVVLPSISEGWPKAIAEGMFWGCVPLATNVSCVSYMLGHGERGIVLKNDLELDTLQIRAIIENQKEFNIKSLEASKWSRKYTLEVFEKEIKDIVHADTSNY